MGFTIFLAAWLSAVPLAHSETVSQGESQRRILLDFKLGGGLVGTTGGSVTALQGSVGARITLFDRLAVGVGLQEGFDIGDQFSPSFFQLEFKPTLALFGGFFQPVETLTLDGKKVLESVPKSRSGFRLHGTVSQYWFHGSLATVPYFGVGGGAYYEWIPSPGASSLSWSVGGRAEYAWNRSRTIVPWQIYLGFGVWLD